MAMKKLDDPTLEAIAEIICGSGQGSGGGASYEAPGPYRSKSEIDTFFNRAGVAPKGESPTRKWFVLESLQALTKESIGGLLTKSLENVILRLANPKEYRGDAETTRIVPEHLNKILSADFSFILAVFRPSRLRSLFRPMPQEPLPV